MGSVLRHKPRDQFALSTKVGRVLRPGRSRLSDFVDAEDFTPVFDFSRDGVRRSLEESLQRLGLDRVDTLLIHDPEEHLDEAVGSAQPELARMRDEGVVDAIGVGTNYVSTLVRFARETDIDCALLAGRFTLLDRSGAEEALPLCQERRVRVVIGGVYNSGVLANPERNQMYDYAPVSPRMRERIALLRELCSRYRVPLAAAALQFPLGHAAVSDVVVGVRTPSEVDENVNAFGLEIPDSLWRALRDASESWASDDS